MLSPTTSSSDYRVAGGSGNNLDGYVEDCPYCGSGSARTLVATPRIVVCATCDLYRVWPRMGRAAQQAYLEAINSHLDLTNWRAPSEAVVSVAWEVEFLKRRVPGVVSGGWALDVGTAEGTFVLGLERAGVKVIGLEPLAKLAAYARSYGLDVRTARFEPDALPADLSKMRFDVICFRESFYYFFDLEETFQLLRILLAPGGHVYVKATQGQSLYFRLWRHNYLSRYNPSVSGIPTPTALRRLFTEEGFRIEYLADYPEHTLRILGFPCNLLTRAVNRVIDPWCRPLLRTFSMQDRVMVLASLTPQDSS